MAQNQNDKTPSSNLDVREDRDISSDTVEKTISSEDISTDAQSSEKKEHTRSKLALLFILGFFAVVFLSFVYASIVKSPISELKEFLVSIIGAFSGLIGFIIGYYYKESQSR